MQMHCHMNNGSIFIYFIFRVCTVIRISFSIRLYIILFNL